MDTLEELFKRSNQVQENIMKSFGYESTEDYIGNGMPTTDAIRKGIVEFDDEIQKAVYADTAENRKLGRVGQEYHRGKGKKEEYNGGTSSVKIPSVDRIKSALEKNPNVKIPLGKDITLYCSKPKGDENITIHILSEKNGEKKLTKGYYGKPDGLSDSVLKDAMKSLGESKSTQKKEDKGSSDSKNSSTSSMIKDILRSDQGSVSDDADTNRAINKITTAAERFFKNNPGLNKKEVLQHAIFDEDDSGKTFKQKYGKMKGAAALSNAIDNLY